MPVLNITVPNEIVDAEEVVVVTWFKREGNAVKKDDVLLIIQFDKVEMEIGAPANGILSNILVQQGEVAKIDQPLAELELTSSVEKEVSESSKPKRDQNSAPSVPSREVRASPIAKRLARQHGIDLTQVVGSGKEGRIVEKDIQILISKQETPSTLSTPQRDVAVKNKIRASPIAKRIAKEHQIDLAQIPGAGERRLTEKDVRTYIENQQAQTEATPIQDKAPSTIVPMAGMRATIAQRMHRSLQEMAQLTLHTEADVTELVDLRNQLKQKFSVTYTDLIIKASAIALQHHPHINATLKEDDIHFLSEVNIGLAVALESGLIVPVIKNVEQHSLEELSIKRGELVKKARQNQLTPSEFTSGTFTVTNLGTYEIDGFTPIVNPPEIAILGVGRIVEKLVVAKGKVAQRFMMTLSLSFDHRLVDGAPAAAFLQSIKRILEKPVDLA
ncbi:MAG: 2-oxo acid dehydrogenase subunit E2 [Chloroflexota bacterium]